MYTLMTGLYKQWTRKEEYYVIILGLDNAGKTVRPWRGIMDD
jgi:ADP-ribosylation factor related protein 1